jgi:hypothetical protein
MARWYISPEVAGQLGERTDLDPSLYPPIVAHLHYQFDGWLGDDLLEAFPCFIVTERLADALEKSALTGWHLQNVTVSKSVMFEDLYPGRELPGFRWLIVDGQQDDDFTVTDKVRLEVSDRALNFLRTHSIDNAIIEPVHSNGHNNS